MNSEVSAGAPNPLSLGVAGPARAQLVFRVKVFQSPVLSPGASLGEDHSLREGGTGLKGFLPIHHLQPGNGTVPGARKDPEFLEGTVLP